MSSLHEIFIAFEKTISISDEDRQLLHDRMNLVQKTIKKHFKNIHLLPAYHFDLHGSFKTETMLKTHKKNVDIDFGIYFLSKPKHTPKELKRILLNSLLKNELKAKNRDKLVRVYFEDGLNIDITIYYLGDEKNISRLAREGSWMPSDPKSMYNWFLEKSSNNYQVIRIVKYFKYWASLNKMKTPSGIAFCVWVIKHIQFNEKDDICFLDTAKSLFIELKRGVYCRNPVMPHDNLVGNLQPRHRKNFIKMLEGFCDSAVLLETQSKSIQFWNNHLGDKFKTIELDGYTQF